MAMLVPFLMIALFAVVVGVAVFVFVVAQAARPTAISTPSAPPALPTLVAGELSRLDQLLATDQLSRAEYQARRNRLLGLPSPPAR